MAMMIAAMVGAILIASSSVLDVNRNQLNYLSQKLDAKNLSLHLNTLSQTPMCNCQLGADSFPDPTVAPVPTLTFDSTVTDGTQFLNIRRIRSGCDATSPVVVQEGQEVGPGLVVKQIHFDNLRPSSGTKWTGDWRISFQQSGSHVVPDAVVAGQLVDVDATSITQAKISACRVQTVDLVCPAGWQMIGTSGEPGAYCIQSTTQTATTFANALANCAAANISDWGPPKICAPNQWWKACPLVPNMKDQQEWTIMQSGMIANGQVVLGGTPAPKSYNHTLADPDMCRHIDSKNLFTGVSNYRCCFP